ncbi:MAG: right-handed parallel beta-helix repeat-containing protein [Candidatus Sulfotelmatobacter sp.]|jgi:hypothetical protein
MFAKRWSEPCLRVVLSCGCLAALVAIPCRLAGSGEAGAAPIPADGPLIIKNQSHKVYQRLRITSSTGDCVKIIDSYDITIENSEIGPCAGNGVNISGGGDIQIFDSYIHPETLSKGCCDHNDGVYAHHTSRITVQGNVIAYGESNIEATKNVIGLVVIGNFLLNPRGPYPRGQNVQAWKAGDIVVKDNYALSSLDTHTYPYAENQEDSINFGFTSKIVASGNYITGGHSPSGCGLIADAGANRAQFTGNRLVDTGQCGIGIASGTDQVVEGNWVVNRNPVPKGGNTAVYVWNQYKRLPCGPVAVSNNIGTAVKQGGTLDGFSNGGGCEPVTLKDNIWGEPARKQLDPVETKLPPPLIPPEPRTCVVQSPYSTQTKWPSCD